MIPIDQMQGPVSKWGQGFASADGQIMVLLEVDGKNTAIKINAERQITDSEFEGIISAVRASLSTGPTAPVFGGKPIPQ